MPKAETEQKLTKIILVPSPCYLSSTCWVLLYNITKIYFFIIRPKLMIYMFLALAVHFINEMNWKDYKKSTESNHRSNREFPPPPQNDSVRSGILKKKYIHTHHSLQCLVRLHVLFRIICFIG